MRDKNVVRRDFITLWSGLFLMDPAGLVTCGRGHPRWVFVMSVEIAYMHCDSFEHCDRLLSININKLSHFTALEVLPNWSNICFLQIEYDYFFLIKLFDIPFPPFDEKSSNVTYLKGKVKLPNIRRRRNHAGLRDAKLFAENQHTLNI